MADAVSLALADGVAVADVGAGSEVVAGVVADVVADVVAEVGVVEAPASAAGVGGVSTVSIM